MTPREKIKKIVDIFGMRQSVAAEALGITKGVFAKNMSERALRHNFNETHVEKLKAYILEKSAEVQKV